MDKSYNVDFHKQLVLSSYMAYNCPVLLEIKHSDRHIEQLLTKASRDDSQVTCKLVAIQWNLNKWYFLRKLKVFTYVNNKP